MKGKPDHATTTPLQWVRVIPVAIRPRSKGERRALAIASDENPDHLRATKIATLAARGCVLLLVLGQLLGCATPIATATTAANQARGFLDVSRGAIEEACAASYGAAKTPADLGGTDAVCLPARRAYLAARAAWMGAVAAILLAQSTGDDRALLALVPRLAAAAVALARAAEALPQ